MEFKNLTFLLLLLLFLGIPIILGIQKKVHFVDRFRYILPAVIFTGAIYITWDIRFAELGIWNYNPDYLSGISMLNLPVEKWLLFALVPVSSIYIYENLKIRLNRFEKHNIFVVISLVLLVVFGLLAFYSRQKLYTFFTFFLLFIYFGYNVFRNRFKKYYATFYFTYLLTLVPYILVSAISNSLPVKSFNADHVTGIAFWGIPVENTGYLFLLLFINITIYEYLNERRFY
ncbi:MAG: lycopene cyclase domain-containing protein [Bacteroidota bacterium]